jgi:hypothetical protein
MTNEKASLLRYPKYRLGLFFTTLSICATFSICAAQQPTSPEFSTFQSVGAQGAHVDEYSGNFSYNLPVLQIPGPDGGGYALSLSYSNVTANQDASWVGYGWTLNPGSITREKVGFADELRGEKIKIWNKAPANNTFSVGANVGLEAFSFGLGVGTSLGYNNYNGFFLTSNAHASLLGVGVNVDLQDIGKDQYEPAYSTSFDPFKALNSGLNARNFYKYADKQKEIDKKALKVQNQRNRFLGQGGRIARNAFSFIDRSYGGWAFPEKSITGFSISGSIQLQLDPGPLPVGLDGGLAINFSRQQDLNTLLGAFNPESHFSEFNAFGYMYSGEAENEHKDLMDFTLDMDGIYSRRSKFLPMPISGADIFVATGEGINGGFRLYNRSAGHYRKNETLSTTINCDLGLDVHLGMDAGAGVGLGYGVMERKTNAWHGSHLDQFKFKTLADGIDEPYFYRFNNDLAGNITFDGTSTAATIQGANLSLPSLTSGLDDGNRSLRSSFIAFHTNEEMLKSFPLSDGLFNYMASIYNPETELMLDRANANPNEVGEFAIHNSDGQLYTYAYPVYARNEKNFSVSVNPDGTIQGNTFALKNIYNESGINPGGNRARVVGSEIDAPYPIHYLLTSITSPNYVDVTKNGATPDDIGGYVKFTYVDITSSGNWFHSRQPVAGLDYTPGDLSDPKDDMASFSSVEKQVPYLQKIETKTHYALFIISDRDEYDAPDNETADTWDWQKNQINTDGLLQLKKLDRIELYSKHENGDRLIQTVNFTYETEDNKKLARGSLTAPDGKLTLKRVWHEQRDIRNALISPYEFQYVYPEADHFPTQIQQQYPDIINYRSQYNGQNDVYSPLKSDAWGYFDVDAVDRQIKYQTWKNQVPGDADPAMWQLKQIILPTQGEVHIQYEQDDYTKVQDKNALAMVSTRYNPGVSSKYYLDIEGALGLNQSDYEAYREKLEDHFITKGEKIYFKFLYSLLTDRTPELDHCDAEYVDGYVDVSSVGYDEGGFFVTLDVSDNKDPKSLCQQMVQFEKNGMLTGGKGKDCLAAAEQISLDDIGEGETLKRMSSLAHQLMNGVEIATRPTSLFCTQMNLDLSYVRVPVLDKKIGGGLRVKRLLQFDQGIEGNPVMTGVEYHYQERINGRMVSTGVAANEPGGIGDEHALQQLEKDLGDGYEKTTAEAIQQKLKLIGGAQRDHREGPVGRSLLPSPSVGYSKVIMKNIHPEEQTFRVNEFLTPASYPIKTNFTTINRSRQITPPIATFDILVENREWATQTYTQDQVDAAGKPLGSALRKGVWNDEVTDIELSSSRFEYFDPFKKIPASSDGSTIVSEELGVASEAVMFSRSMLEQGINTSVGFDMTFAFVPPFIVIPYPIPSLSIKMSVNDLNQHTISITSQRPLIQKSVVENNNGVVTKSENVAFDPLSGLPSIVRTYDDYHQMQVAGMASQHNGTITQKQFPAHATYSEVGVKSENEGIRLNQFYSSVMLYKPAVDKYELALSSAGDDVPPCEIKMRDKIVAGDMLELRDADDHVELYHVSETIKDGKVTLFPLTLAAPGAYNDIADATEVNALVIKSGRTNQLSANVGNIVLYGEPVAPTHSSLHNHIIDLTESFNEAVAEDANNFEIGAAELPADIRIKINSECHTLANSFKIVFSTSDQAWFDCKISAPLKGAASGSIQIIVPVGTTFAVDELGWLRYFTPDDAECGKQVECFRFCLDEGNYIAQEKVIAISAQILSDDWRLPGSAVNPYETGEKGKWRQESGYAFLSPDVINGNNLAAGERNYKDAGTFTAKLFDWHNVGVNDNNGWIKTQQIEQYTRSGLPVLQRDALNISSVIKYDYNNLFPLLVAANANINNVMFENCENIITDEEGDITVTESWLSLNPVDNFIDSEHAHTGKKSIAVVLVNGNGEIDANASQAIIESQNHEGYSIRMWLRSSQPNTFEGKIRLINTNGSSKDFKVISSNNEWKLIEVIMTKIDMQPLALGQPLFSKITFTDINGSLSVDDIQIKPLDAVLTAYVYDRETLNLIAEIDNTNFSKRYQYDVEGKLTRVRVETDKGIHTTKESFSQIRTKTREE